MPEYPPPPPPPSILRSSRNDSGHRSVRNFLLKKETPVRVLNPLSFMMNSTTDRRRTSRGGQEATSIIGRRGSAVPVIVVSRTRSHHTHFPFFPVWINIIFSRDDRPCVFLITVGIHRENKKVNEEEERRKRKLFLNTDKPFCSCIGV